MLQFGFVSPKNLFQILNLQCRNQEKILNADAILLLLEVFLNPCNWAIPSNKSQTNFYLVDRLSFCYKCKMVLKMDSKPPGSKPIIPIFILTLLNPSPHFHNNRSFHLRFVALSSMVINCTWNFLKHKRYCCLRHQW